MSNQEKLSLIKMVMDAHWDSDIETIISKIKKIQDELFPEPEPYKIYELPF